MSTLGNGAARFSESFPLRRVAVCSSAFTLPESPASHQQSNRPPMRFMPNAFVRIGSDDRVTVIVNHSEMGQGVYTSLPMLLAEELDADWTKVGFEPAPVDPKYNHPAFGMQMTGGSSSVWSGLEQFRQAGAAARAMLIAAAAQQWKVDATTCRTESGVVFDQGESKTDLRPTGGRGCQNDSARACATERSKDLQVDRQADQAPRHSGEAEWQSCLRNRCQAAGHVDSGRCPASHLRREDELASTIPKHVPCRGSAKSSLFHPALP